MKATIAVTVIIILFYSCKKADNGPAYYISATVNGTSFYDTNCVAMASPSSLEIYEQYNPTGNGAYTNLSLEITAQYNGPGNYQFPDTTGSVTMAGAAIDSAGNELVGTVGSITITEASPKVVGTFSFTCVDGSKVKGAFSARVIQ